jgi:hypothetical protein
MLMKMIILRFAPGSIHPQAKAWDLLAFSINLSLRDTKCRGNLVLCLSQ